jgi:ABC-type phosphate/phosphonate transport system ATPase subunit
MEKKEIIVTRSLLEANDLIANRVRNNIRGKTFFVNIISSPGSGKTTLLEKTSDILKKDYSVAIITADIETDRDKKRLEREGVKVIQLNTMGGCHLEASIMEQLFGDLLRKKNTISYLSKTSEILFARLNLISVSMSGFFCFQHLKETTRLRNILWDSRLLTCFSSRNPIFFLCLSLTRKGSWKKPCSSILPSEHF